MADAFAVDDLQAFEQLAVVMNDHPERYEVLGDLDLVLGILMTRGEDAPFGARVTFEGIRCVDVSSMEPGDERLTDCWLEGPIEAWREMVDDIRRNGRATGRQTLNSLTMMGDAIRLRGADVMGVDKFSRFNQSLQEFVDAFDGLPVRQTTG